MPTPPSLDDLRRYAVARTLFKPTTLLRAIVKLGFVQADPIRAPARAQDLTLRHRVAGYRAGDLERRYEKLPVEEDALVNYGFLPRASLALMHPRSAARVWDAKTKRRAADILAFVREHGPTHPKTIQAHFDHGRRINAWGGSGNAATQLLDGMHYRGLLRIRRRENGIRIYEVDEHAPVDEGPEARTARAAALLELMLRKYAPLPRSSFVYLTRLLLNYGAPQLAAEARSAMAAAREHFASATVEGTEWYWPTDEHPRSRKWKTDDAVRLLAPFDPIVWDRRRFELLWGWTYRFEAYTPAHLRRLGYYALPVLWRDRVVGWSNASIEGSRLKVATKFALEPVRDQAFRDGLAAEKARMAEFLGL